MTDKTIPFSVLDLAPIHKPPRPEKPFSHSLDLAQLAESVAITATGWRKHHNMVGIASAATSVLIGYLAANTTTLHGLRRRDAAEPRPLVIA